MVSKICETIRTQSTKNPFRIPKRLSDTVQCRRVENEFSIGQSKTAQKNTIISVFLIGEKIKIEKIIVGNACPEHSKIPILHQSNSLMTFQHDFLLVDISIFVLQFNYEQAYFGECLMNFSAFLFQLFWIENVRWLVSESYKRRTCCRPKR